VDRADPSCIGLVGAHPLIHAALLVKSDTFGEWAMCLLRVSL
jgi:hypothetical protein